MGLLLCGVLALIASLAIAAFALVGPSGERVSRERLARYRVVEEKPRLAKISDGITAQVEQVLRRRGWRPFTAAELELAGIRMPVASLVVLVSCIAIAGFAVGFALPL